MARSGKSERCSCSRCVHAHANNCVLHTNALMGVLALSTEKLALERLVRRISPVSSNSASSHSELLHILHLCCACSTRVSFCTVCAAKASEFFSGYTTPELFALYGRDLPPADAEALEAFANAVADREFRATHEE